MLRFSLLLSLFCLGIFDRAIAHTVKNNNGVGSTFHIEPKHNPRAGESSLAWFALTSKGGEIIPLGDCNCQLKVTAEIGGKERTIATPELQSISPENYRDVPSAKITFPHAGIYELTISGSPKSGNSFSPFTLSYRVTVGANSSRTSQQHDDSQEKAAAATTTEAETATEISHSNHYFGWIFGGLSIIGTIGALFLSKGRSKP